MPRAKFFMPWLNRHKIAFLVCYFEEFYKRYRVTYLNVCIGNEVPISLLFCIRHDGVNVICDEDCQWRKALETNHSTIAEWIVTSMRISRQSTSLIPLYNSEVLVISTKLDALAVNRDKLPVRAATLLDYRGHSNFYQIRPWHTKWTAPDRRGRLAAPLSELQAKK